MTEKIIIAGAGGQGIMLLGKILAEAACAEKKHVTFLPAYGAEVRGGTAHCMVIISNSPIGSPYIQKADTLIIMNSPSLKKFKQRIKRGGVLLLNTSLVDMPEEKNIKISGHPFTENASRLGNIKIANMIALGLLIRQKRIVKAETVLKIINEIPPSDKKNLIEINQKALKEGLSLK